MGSPNGGVAEDSTGGRIAEDVGGSIPQQTQISFLNICRTSAGLSITCVTPIRYRTPGVWSRCSGE